MKRYAIQTVTADRQATRVGFHIHGETDCRSSAKRTFDRLRFDPQFAAVHVIDNMAPRSNRLVFSDAGGASRRWTITEVDAADPDIRTMFRVDYIAANGNGEPEPIGTVRSFRSKSSWTANRIDGSHISQRHTSKRAAVNAVVRDWEGS